MDVKKYLRQLQVMDIKINQDLQLLEEMKSNAVCASGAGFAERVHASHSCGKVDSVVTSYVDFNETINREIDRYYDMRVRITNQIHALNDVDFIQVLFKFYIQFKGVDEISREMKKSKRWVYEKHHQALDEFGRIHPNLKYLF